MGKIGKVKNTTQSNIIIQENAKITEKHDKNDSRYNVFSAVGKMYHVVVQR